MCPAAMGSLAIISRHKLKVSFIRHLKLSDLK